MGRKTESPVLKTPEYTLTKVSEPTKGSVAILNAIPEKGSSSSDDLLPSSSLSRIPVTGLTSLGAGKKSTTASSMVCTPLFLNADPQRQGTISLLNVLSLIPIFMSSSDKSPSSRYLSINSSLASAADSTIFSRHSSARPLRSSGISSSVKVVPMSSPFQ